MLEDRRGLLIFEARVPRTYPYLRTYFYELLAYSTLPRYLAEELRAFVVGRAHSQSSGQTNYRGDAETPSLLGTIPILL